MKKDRLGIYMPLLILVAAAAVTLRSVACLIHLDYNLGHFEEHSLINAASIVVTAGCIILLSYAVFGSASKLAASFTTAYTYIPTGIVGVSLLFLSIELIGFSSSNDGDPALASSQLPKAVALLCAILALLSIGHFFLNAYIPARESARRSYYGLATVAFLAFYAAYLYFNGKTPINAPNKIVDQMAFLFSALFFLYEIRISLGRERWRGYISFGFAAALLLAYSSIPSLIVYFVKGEIISDTLAENVFTFALFLFVTLRLLLVELLPSDKPSLATENVTSFAEERAESVRIREEEYLEKYATQLTIDDLLLNCDAEDEEADESPYQIEESETDTDEEDSGN